MPVASTSCASRGSSAQCVMRMAASWKTISMPSMARRTRSASRMSPSTIVTCPKRRALFQVLLAAARQVVEDDDVLEAFGDQAIGDVRADQTRAAGDQRSFVIHDVFKSILLEE